MEHFACHSLAIITLTQFISFFEGREIFENNKKRYHYETDCWGQKKEEKY